MAVSIDVSGPAAALARIGAIQSRFAALAAPASATGSTTGSKTGSTTSGAASATGVSSATSLLSAATGADAPGSSFDAVLGDALTRAGAVGGAATDGPASDGGVGARAVAAGRKYLGVPYVWGGTDPAKGLDCSGLVQRAYADVGVRLPRVAADQARVGTAVPDLAHARPGDLVAFGSPVDHIGIYVGDGKMLVAPRAGKDVMVQDVYRTPTAIRRVSEPAGAVVRTYAGGSAPVAALAAQGAAGSTSGVPSWVPAQWRTLFATAAARHGVPAALLASVARAESGFDPRAVSPAGAVGLMQLMPSTARGLGVDPRDPAQAVDGAARLLSSHLRRFGSTPLALAAYNAGPGAVERYAGVPPYRETQQYVQRVLGYAGVGA